MFILLVIPILMVGYFIQRNNYSHYYQLHRYTGQLLYLKSIYLGTLCLLISFVISEILLKFCKYNTEKTYYSYELLLQTLSKFLLRSLQIEDCESTVKKTAIYLSIFLIYIVIAHAMSYGHNFCKILLRLYLMKEDKTTSIKEKWLFCKVDYFIYLKRQFFGSNPLDELLINSFNQSKALIIHMNDRKVYIGFISKLSEPNEEHAIAQEVVIFPLKSGYRDKDTLTVSITTEYDNKDKLFIVLRRSEIISLSEYDETIFLNFQKTQAKKIKRNGIISIFKQST